MELTAGHPGVMGEDPLAAVEEMAALGVTRMIIPPLAWDVDSATEAYAAFSERVIQKV